MCARWFVYMLRIIVYSRSHFVAATRVTWSFCALRTRAAQWRSVLPTVAHVISLVASDTTARDGSGNSVPQSSSVCSSRAQLLCSCSTAGSQLLTGRFYPHYRLSLIVCCSLCRCQVLLVGARLIPVSRIDRELEQCASRSRFHAHA